MHDNIHAMTKGFTIGMILRLSLFLAAPGFVRTISAENQDWVAPGAEKVKEKLLYGQAVSPNRETKNRALEDLSRSIDSGTAKADDPFVLDVLAYLAQEGIKTEVRTGPNAGKSYPEIRRKACDLLGRLGGPGAEEILYSVLESEAEPMVLSEAVFALGRAGVKPNERLYRDLTKLLSTDVLLRRDDNLAYVCLALIERLDVPSHRMNDPELFRVLVRMLDAPLIGEVRRKAYEVVEKLRN